MPKGVKLKDKEGYVYPCPFFPVGSIYMSVNSTNPSTYFGGTWVEIQGRFLLGRSSSYTAGSQGGEASHKLTVSEMPSHNHSFSGTANSAGSHTHRLRGYDKATASGTVGYRPGGGGTSYAGDQIQSAGAHTHSVSGTIGSSGSNTAHNNMPPYLAVYIWKRTA